MENNYESKYFEFIVKGLHETIYEFDKKPVTKEVFFNDLVLLTSEIKNNNGRIFFIGNGASAAFSNHMALDWSKNGGIHAISLSDSALLTALSNDYSYEEAFVKYLEINYINKNDVVVTISSSGNSPNVTNVLKYCERNDIKIIGFSGLKPNNSTRAIANYSLYVPRKTYGFVECIHQVFLHLWLDKFMQIFEWDRESFQNMSSKKFKL